MIGRLIQGYGRGGQLESATEETHTRTLLWPEVHHDGRPSSVSPPSTPFGSPTFRVSPFDDRAGLALNETRDLRLIIAQDAFGTNDRPLLLFDSQPVDPIESILPERTATSSQPTSHFSRAGPGTPMIGHMRNRSSTMSGGSASWGRSNKESETTDHLSNVLDCMFGVSSAIKTGSSTKLHFFPGHQSPASDLSPGAPTSSPTAPSRAPFTRAKTAINSVNNQIPQNNAKSTNSEPRDAVLITRMFPVPLPETQDDLRQHRNSSAGPANSQGLVSHDKRHQADSTLQAKKPKLVEKKTPVFAIGLLFYLPRPGDVRPGTSSALPSSRASFTAPSTPSSQGSGSFSSWMILNAIPAHLWTEEASSDFTDRGIEIVTRNWDVVLRSLAAVETLARAKISELLQEVNFALITSAAKAPKGPYEQRTNQRNVYLRSPNRLAGYPELQRVIKHTLWRISYALRVPRVLTGLGLDNGGHWLDEARYLVRLCGSKQQNFFLFNLLTAFLGNHTEWLERLGPDWYRKQFRALHKGKPRSNNLASRTVIICDSRSMARRIIFLLASFLPHNALVKQGSEYLSPLMTPDISSSSAANKIYSEGSLHRHAHNKSRDGQFMFSRREISGLSTSISSSESVSGISKAFRGHARLATPSSQLEPGTGRHTSVLAPTNGQGQVHKTNATSATVTPGGGTPIPHFATKTDSYFPESVIADGDESGASADLARILRRDSTSQARSRPQSISWDSLVNNVSGFWNKGQDSTTTSDENKTISIGVGLSERRRLAPKSVPIQERLPSQIETMINEATGLQKHESSENNDGHTTMRHSSIDPIKVRPPQLTVDEKDGVIDVDLNLPGFISWNEGKSAYPHLPLHHHSPSFASTDEGASSYSSHSLGFDDASSNPANVAGYLKRYHEDFILQGLRSYADLQKEIKQSMSREPTPADSICVPLQEPQAKGEHWANVCTTLLADFRTFTVQRLTLRRLVQQQGRIHTDTTDSKVEDISKASIAPTKAQIRPRDVGTELFGSENVMDFDTTLTHAIERVLNDTDATRQKSQATSGTHSRTVSTATSSSARSVPLAIGKNRASQATSTTSQSDCRQAVVGALEEVVKSVNNDLAKYQRARGADGKVQLDGDAVKREMRQDNVLREGVKKWLLNVETRSVW